MLELLDRIRASNFGHQIDYKPYQGNDRSELALIAAGIETLSVYADGKDMRVTLHSFNANRSEESINETVHHVSNIIKLHV